MNASDASHRRARLATVAMAFVLALPGLVPLDGLARAAQDGAPRFERSSLTPASSRDAPHRGPQFEAGGHFAARNVTLRQLLEIAYRRHPFDQREIAGGPPWMDADRFDVVATAAGEHIFDPDGMPRQTLLMLRQLIADEFRLKLRHDMREEPVYAMVVASTDGRVGSGLRRSAVNCGDVMAGLARGERPAGPPQCGFGPYPRRLVGSAVTMPALASYLSRLVKRPVLDRTGLTGNFDLEVEGIEVVQPGPPGPSTRPSDTTRSIVDMLPEQLGLRLQDARGAVEVLVIEHAEKPAPR